MQQYFNSAPKRIWKQHSFLKILIRFDIQRSTNSYMSPNYQFHSTFLNAISNYLYCWHFHSMCCDLWSFRHRTVNHFALWKYFKQKQKMFNVERNINYGMCLTFMESVFSVSGMRFWMAVVGLALNGWMMINRIVNLFVGTIGTRLNVILIVRWIFSGVNLFGLFLKKIKQQTNGSILIDVKS